MVFLNTLKKISLFFILIFFCNIAHTQNEETIISQTELDSLHELYFGEITEEAYAKHHELLRQSINLSYNKGILSAYKALLWYHGANRKANLDSLLHYADLFETKIESIDKNDTLLINALKLPNYYLNKGQLIANGFGLPEQGLESYFEAYPLIPKENIQLSIYYNIAISQIYTHKFQYDKALNILTPYLKDTINLEPLVKMRLLQNISANYVLKKMPEKSFPLHKKTLSIAENNNNINQIWWTKNKLAHDYFRFGDYQKAIDSALVVRDFAIKNKFHGIFFNNTINLSTYYHAIGDLKKAIAYRKEALKLEPGFEEKKDIYNNLAQYYIENRQYINAIDIYKKKSVIVDSIRSNEKKVITNYIDSNVKLLKEKQKSQQMLFNMELLEVKNKKQKLYYISISIVLICIILLLGSILIFRKYRKGEKVIEILKSNEKRLLEEKIVLRENELEASAIALSQRIETLTSIKNELDEIKRPQIPELEEAKLKIKKLIRSASDMAIITKRIESEHPTMTAKLKDKYPNLSDTQIRYCLLTKLNLSIKETAIILNVTPDTVKVARSRLKKKLSIPTEMSIKLFLDNLIKE